MPIQDSVTSYPSVVVHLILKFEEKLTVRVNEGGDNFVNEPLVTNPGSVGAQVMNRVPQKCTVDLQGHTQAATFKLAFDYRELPIDPRTVSAARIEIYAGTVSAENFADGMNREVTPGVRRSILATRTPEGRTIDKDLRLVGLVDKWTVDMGEEGSEVQMEGRDLRGLLLDSPLVTPRDMPRRGGTPPRAAPAGRQPRKKRSSILDRLDCSQNIAALVLQILEEHDQIRRLPFPIEVSCRAEQFDDGIIPSPGNASHVPRHRRGAGGRGASPGGGADNMNFWDLITRYCQIVGCVPRFVGRRLVISPGKDLFRQLNTQLSETAFLGNAVRSNNEVTDTWGIRRLVYGRDIKTMKITRNYAGHAKPKAVRVVTFNRSAITRGRHEERHMEAVWPPRNVREGRAEGLSTGHGRDIRDSLGGQESQEVLTIVEPRATTMAQLVSVAQSMYEQIGRGEIKGDIEAAGLTSFGGSNADPDLIRLRVGDPVEVLVDASHLDSRSPIVSTLNRTMQLPFSEAVAEVRRYLRDENLSRAIVASARGNVMGVLRYFRVSGVTLDFSGDTMTVKMEIQNYWTPRWDYVTNVEQQHNRQQRNHGDARHPTARQHIRNVVAGMEETVADPRAARVAIERRFDDIEAENRRIGDALGHRSISSNPALGSIEEEVDPTAGVSRWRGTR